jgi:hypothetical protein
MRKSHFNDEFLVLLGPIISRLFTCSNEEKNKIKKRRVLALVLSLWVWAQARQVAREADKAGRPGQRMYLLQLPIFL